MAVSVHRQPLSLATVIVDELPHRLRTAGFDDTLQPERNSVGQLLGFPVEIRCECFGVFRLAPKFCASPAQFCEAALRFLKTVVRPHQQVVHFVVYGALLSPLFLRSRCHRRLDLRFCSGLSGQPSYRSKRLVDFCPSCLHLPPCPCWAYPPETTGAPAEVVEKTAGACERRPAHVRGKRTDLGEKTALVWYACAPPLRLPALLWLWVCTHCVSGHPRCCRYGVGIRFSFINLPLFRPCRVHLLQKDYRLTAGRRAGLLALLAPLSRFSISPPLSIRVPF